MRCVKDCSDCDHICKRCGYGSTCNVISPIICAKRLEIITYTSLETHLGIKNMFLFFRLKTEKKIRTFLGSKWVRNKNIEAQKKIRRFFLNKRSVAV